MQSGSNILILLFLAKSKQFGFVNILLSEETGNFNIIPISLCIPNFSELKHLKISKNREMKRLKSDKFDRSSGLH
jgi:hypothetical protein